MELWNFETIRGSLMTPKGQKLASLARKYVHSSFSSLVQSLLPKDTLLRTYLLGSTVKPVLSGHLKIDKT